MNANKYFLPYQTRWLEDAAPIKIWEKSRRIGATYVQAYEDVREAAQGKWDVWFSSADESAAREYILYCAKWARIFDKAAQYLGSVVLDSHKDVKAYVVTFANGRRINALSSNPKAFRSKGGKVILDEFAWHEDAETLWAAARPCITWGFPLRILSTHNGMNCRFYKLIESVNKGKLKWSHHITTIQTAVEEGLADKITSALRTPHSALSNPDREAWLQEQRESCFDENTWLQEYCCVPVDEASAFLSYEMLYGVEKDNLLWPSPQSPDPNPQVSGDLYGGMDIGRKKDLSVIWLVEKLGLVKYTRLVKIMERTAFRVQRETLFEFLKHPRMRRFCIDASGLGMQLAEEAQEAFGRYKVEAVTFTGPVKEDLGYALKHSIEDRQIYIPADFDIREDFHSIRKITTASNNIRFDVAASEARGHADRFWACALANHAAGDKSTAPIEIATRQRRESNELMRGY